jgi:SulP family sulfate permease
MASLIENSMEFLPETVVIGGGTLALILVWNRLVPRVPGYIVALVTGTVAVALAGLPVETIGSPSAAFRRGCRHSGCRSSVQT